MNVLPLNYASQEKELSRFSYIPENSNYIVFSDLLIHTHLFNTYSRLGTVLCAGYKAADKTSLPSRYFQLIDTEFQVSPSIQQVL